MTTLDSTTLARAAVALTNRLCDTIGRTHFVPADPQSEFHWEKISRVENRKPLYEKMAGFLAEDTVHPLSSRLHALEDVVANACARLERLAWMWVPHVNGTSKIHVDVVVSPNKAEFGRKDSGEPMIHTLDPVHVHKNFPAQHHEAEELDMELNTPALLASATRLLDMEQTLTDEIAILPSSHEQWAIEVRAHPKTAHR